MYEIDSRMYELAVFRSLERYPYSKMCELCELCELLERKIPPLSRWDLLIYPQQNLFVFSGTPEISDFWGEPLRGPQRALLEWGELKPKSPQLLRSSGFLRP